MKTIYILIFLNLLSYTIIAQEDKLKMFENMPARSIGPAVMSGRVTSIAADSKHPEKIWIGSASGGVWKSVDAGVTWESVFHDQPISSIGALALDPLRSGVIWAGTGEGNPRNSQNLGIGIFRSPDGGKTWRKSGLDETFSIHRILCDPIRAGRVFVASMGNSWKPQSERGVFRSTDDGVSWKKVLFVDDTTGCSDLVMDPTNPDKLFAGMYHYERKPYHFYSGGKSGGLYMTHDGGESWTRLKEENGLPKGITGRIGLAIAPSEPQIIYALIEADKSGLYKSADGGYNWSLINDKNVSDRPFYYHEIYVNPKNPNHLIYLHSTMTESIDGGKTWTTLLPYYGVHPDHHALWWNPSNPQHIIDGNDGGLNISYDGGQNWQFVNSLPLGQFYHVEIDNALPYNVYGGLQDNGSWRGPAYALHHGGINDADWQELLFGDGFDVQPHPLDNRYVYAMWQQGELNLVDTETGLTKYIRPHAEKSGALRFNWNGALSLDPANPDGIYFGSQHLHYSSNRGESWQTISPDLTDNDSTKLKQYESGGLTRDQTSAENYCTLICIAPRAQNTAEIWTGSDDGNLYVTRDAGKNWTSLSKRLKEMPTDGYIQQIVHSSIHASETFVTVNNYRQGDYKPYLFHTTDGGNTWKQLVNNDYHKTGYVMSFMQDKEIPQLLFLGCERGLFISNDYGKTWMRWKHGIPAVPVSDIKIQQRENDLVLSTFGNGIFIIDDIRPLRRWAQNPNHYQKNLTMNEIHDTYQWQLKRPMGARFGADGDYSGQNRSTGARIGIHVNFDKEKTTKQVDDDSKKIKVFILNEKRDTIRHLETTADTGFNFLHWNFESDGIHFPSRDLLKNKKGYAGNGVKARPGRYLAIAKFLKYQDSVYFEVKDDPRIGISMERINLYESTRYKIDSLISRAATYTDLLITMKEHIHLMDESLRLMNDTSLRKNQQLGDSIKKEIDRIFDLFFLPEDTRGIVDDSHTINSLLYTAMYNNSRDDISESNKITYRHALEGVEKAKEKINELILGKWIRWSGIIRSKNLNLIPQIEKVN